MSTQITIIGVGQIGTSVGLALERYEGKFLRVGHDIDSGITNKAKKMGALDKVAFNLLAAVEDADIVVMALPVDQVRETLSLIAAELKEGVVVLDTSPVRGDPTGWADELLPKGRHYVGFTPLLSPLYLHDVTSGVDSAHADLFDHGLIAISATPETVSAAMRTASDLAELLKATPLFADIMEVDGYMAALHLMPQLIAGALSQATTSQPGWHEGRKFAGRAYAQVSSSITNLDEPVGLATTAVLNKQNTVRVLDGMIAELQTLRDEIEAGDHETLEKHLQKARGGRQRWWADRGAANWIGENIPKMDIAGARPSLFGRLIPERKRPDEG